MNITFFSYFINHHQVWVADELYNILGNNYKFVSIYDLPEKFRKNGYANYFDRKYLVCAFTPDGHREAMRLARESDVAIFGGANEAQIFREERMTKGVKDKITFECGERWLKKGYKNLLSPRLLMFQWRYHTRYCKVKKYYNLSMSAYGTSDYKLMHSFIGKCYKWAYFTEVEGFDVGALSFSGKRIMWCNRFIGWKHPELAIKMAKQLQDDGYDFVLDMYGAGNLLKPMKSLAQELGVANVVKIHGIVPNDEIRKEMLAHDILLTTSDRNEGWGATVNEGMSMGCVVIGADEVGSVPRLIKDGYNGLIFKANSLESLCAKVKQVLGQPDKCKGIAINAYNTMSKTWSPKNGAEKLIYLCDCLLNDKPIDISDGPCSLDV
jgi:glycosyltransferase involved in cell wall biosynthesis